MPTAMKRIGLLGGSFDPIHTGHLQLARDAIHALGLDELRLVVAAQPWQKPDVSPAAQRLRMVEVAVASVEPALRARLAIERCELDRTGPSYTIDTLTALRAALGPAPCLVLVMGSDQWHNLGTWRRHAELTDYASIAVARRDTLAATDATTHTGTAMRTGTATPAGPAIAAHDAPRDAALPAVGALTVPHGQSVAFAMTPHPASATAIRAQLRAGQAVGPDLLPPTVLAYIRAQHLYGNPA